MMMSGVLRAVVLALGVCASWSYDTGEFRVTEDASLAFFGVDLDAQPAQTPGAFLRGPLLQRLSQSIARVVPEETLRQLAPPSPLLAAAAPTPLQQSLEEQLKSALAWAERVGLSSWADVVETGTVATDYP